MKRYLVTLLIFVVASGVLPSERASISILGSSDSVTIAQAGSNSVHVRRTTGASWDTFDFTFDGAQVITGPAAANMARALMGDQRMKRGRKFLANRRFHLILDDAVVIVGNRGKRLVFVPFSDGIGEREAYLLHTSKGDKDEVTIAVLYFNSRQAYARIRVSYFGLQEELWWPVVEEAYVVDEYSEIVYIVRQQQPTGKSLGSVLYPHVAHAWDAALLVLLL